MAATTSPVASPTRTYMTLMTHWRGPSGATQVSFTPSRTAGACTVGASAGSKGAPTPTAGTTRPPTPPSRAAGPTYAPDGHGTRSQVSTLTSEVSSTISRK